MSEGIAYGDYYLLGRLGTGGTAEVFLGKRLGDSVGGRLLAVKRLLTQFAGNPELIKTFQDESRIASILRHPNIVETIDSGVNNKQHFLVMEFIHGKDLKTIQQRARKTGAPLSYVASAYIAAAIADALDYAHGLEVPDELGKSVVHRDLSPQKLLISYDGVPKVIDFSARDAKSRGIEGRIGSIKGRFGYLSPEQAISNPADRRSDVFSLGVILYEMTTGMAPFRGGSDAATLGKVARASFSPPDLVNAGMPRVLGKIIERAMQREPDKRYATAAEMAEALRAFIRDDGQVIDKGELARIMRELFFEDYEREKVRVEQYRRLTHLPATGSGSKPLAMGDSPSGGGLEGSRTRDIQDERTTADDPRLSSIDDDDDTGVSDAEGAPLDDHVERTDTGISGDIPDTGVHHDVSDSGVHREITDTGVHLEVTDTSTRADGPVIIEEQISDSGLFDAVQAIDEPVTESPGAAQFIASTDTLQLIPFEPTPGTESVAPAAEPELVTMGDFSFTVDEVMPKLDDEPTGADQPVAREAIADAPVQLANPWAGEGGATSSFTVPPAALNEGPTVVVEPLFGDQGPGDALFQLKTPTAASPSIIFEAKTKVYEDSIADLVRRTQPSGFGVEITKQDFKRPKNADNAQIAELLAVVNPAPPDGMNVATTVQPLHVSTVVATPPEKAVTQVAMAHAKSKKKKGRGPSQLDESDTAADKVEDIELLDDEAFARSGPFPDDADNAPRTVATPMPGAMLDDGPDEEADDDDEYEEVGRFFSRSDMITLVVAAFMGLLIMTASYVYALNAPLPDQNNIIEER
ncbi:MAG TPA: serine/threonine-protein kinase [Myxococcota bacterium]|nr:serine/threonine-protein kinase [Myxococcota bacterium]